MAVKPIRDKILILPCAADEKSEGGIIVPDSVKKRPSKGVVISAGPGLQGQPMQFIPGDTIFHIKDCGEKWTCDGIDYYMIDQRDVLAKLKR